MYYFSFAPSILQLENPGSIDFVNLKFKETIIEQNFNSFVKSSSGKTIWDMWDMFFYFDIWNDTVEFLLNFVKGLIKQNNLRLQNRHKKTCLQLLIFRYLFLAFGFIIDPRKLVSNFTTWNIFQLSMVYDVGQSLRFLTSLW